LSHDLATMGRDRTHQATPDLFSTDMVRDASPPPTRRVSATEAATDTASKRHVLPNDLPSAVKYLTDRELDLLITASVEEAKASSAAMSAWIDSNRSASTARAVAKTAHKPTRSIVPQSTAPTKRSRKRKADATAAPLASTHRNSVTGTPLRIPYGNKDVALKLGARYGSAGWYAPPGVDLSVFGERGWL
jgi:hypothetical protein